MSRFALAFIGLLVLAGFPRLAIAQGDPGQRKVSVNFHETDVREVLEGLFKMTGASYVIPFDVQGMVNIKLSNVTLDTAVQQIVRQVDASCSVQDEIYDVELHRSSAKPTDAATVHVESLNTLSVEAKDSDVRAVLAALFNKMQLPYAIAPDVQGLVDSNVKGVSFQVALTNLLQQVGAKLQIVNGVFRVMNVSPSATDKTNDTVFPSLEFEGVGIRDVLRQLFKPDNTFYSADPEVQGEVTVSLKNVTLECALRHLLRAVHGRYQVQGDMFLVTGIDLAPERHLEVGEIVDTVDLDYFQANVRDVLRQLFKTAGVSYTIDSDVQGFVTLALKNQTLESALPQVLRLVDATYRIEGGVYQVMRRHGAQLVRQNELG